MNTIKNIFEKYYNFRLKIYRKYNEQIPGYWEEINPKDIFKIEQSLQIKFSPDFHWWLLYHNNSDTPEYVYWINKKGWPDLMRHYHSEHFEVWNPMPEYLVPFSPDGWWNHYCFHKKMDGIYFWQHDMDFGPRNPIKTHESFTNWFVENVDRYIKRNT